MAQTLTTPTAELANLVQLMQVDELSQLGLLVLEDTTPLTISDVRNTVPHDAKVAVINNPYDDDTFAAALTQAAGGWLVLLLNADPSPTTYNQLTQFKQYGQFYLPTPSGIVTVEVPTATKVMVVMADSLLDDISYHELVDHFDLVLRSHT